MAKYINADALVKRIDKELCKPCRDEKQDYNGVRCRACWVDDMLIWIDSEPTADVRENVHVRGYWLVANTPNEFYMDNYYCSNCEREYYSTPKFIAAALTLCPNCGAIMDEVTE